MKFPLHRTLDLNGAWSLFYANETPTNIDTVHNLQNSNLPSVPANVPGNVELDLQAAGIIGEPFFGMNSADLHRYEKTHWWYTRRFEATLQENCEPFLRFEGLDCYADIFLNGTHIGACDNALIENEYSIGGILREGENEVVVHIRPAGEEAKKYSYPPGVAANRASYESLYVRKAPHCYGWDIMPRALSAGLWRPVKIVFRPAERLNSVFLRTVSASEQHARLILHFQAHQLKADTQYEIEIEGIGKDEAKGSRFYKRERLLFEAGRISIDVAQPQLWWPRGRGGAHLYDVTVRLLKNCEGCGCTECSVEQCRNWECDRAEFRHGIRTIQLERTSTTDMRGNGEFCFHVNGEKVFILGSNHVPADAYHSRDARRLPRILELAEEIGCNLLRCWGGNVYENDLFFDLCDEKGILIWQDFAMACAVYPQDEKFQKRLEHEAQTVVRRLRQHPCLALWAGDNECDQAYSWHSCGDPNRNVLTRRVLPEVLRAEDPGRDYLPSSPYIDEAAFQAGETFLPENHLWGPRDNFKSDYYRNALCHFASEIGYHGCPSPDSIRRFISPEKLWPPGNDEWLLHSTSPVPGVNLYDYRVELMRKQVRELFGTVPENLEDFAFVSQCVQAEAKKFFIEMFRSAKWRRTGIVWWNLIDGWPQFSDAVVDYYFTKKLAFDFIQRAQQPLCLMLREPANWQQQLVACNDTRHTIEIEYTVRDVGSEKPLCEGHATAKADAVTILDALPFSTSEKRFYLIEWRAVNDNSANESTHKGKNHYLAGLPPFDLENYRSWLRATGWRSEV